MVFCPNCGMENADSAKFCKQCGNPLIAGSPIKDNYVNTGMDPTARVNDSSQNNSKNNSNSSSDNKNLIIACLTIVICALLIAGAFVAFFNSSLSDDGVDDLSDSASLNDTSLTEINESSANSNEPSSDMKIISGSFSTGSSKSDKTYCSVYVGEQYAGENVKISVLYSRDGFNLNKGNIIPKTVDGSGYVSVPSADAFKYYPDDAFITLYDSDGNILDTQEVYLTPKEGKQTF